MSTQKISLNDRYNLDRDTVLLNGTQALVRLMMMQKVRDRAAGLNTAGLVTGYRGSPLGAVDLQMMRAAKPLAEHDVTFQPGLNEDLAATALWGSQQAELRGEGKYDGVFGLWYGKGPGVDRSGDVFKHANMAGSSKHGGVLVAMGDDHTGESSTVLHQSEFALLDAYMPVVSPAGVQEIMDYGLYGWALSRFSGLWVGLKTMKDTIEATSVVNGNPNRLNFVVPEFNMPKGGLNIRLVDTPVEQETRVIDHKCFAAEAFSRANGMDKRVWGKPGAKIGFVAAGKNWLDLMHAMDLLHIDENEAERLGITTYKVGQTWPLDMDTFHEWAAGLDLIVVVEEKRKLIEVQIKEAIFDDRDGRRVYGWHKGDTWEHGRRLELFPTRGALDPILIAEKLGDILIEEGRNTDGIQAGLASLSEARRNDNAQDLAARLPYFCSGCPHNTSTKLPDGSRAYAGIGCHYMVQWMDRGTVGYTHMGGEGANWIGEAPFSTTDHVFQNLGDGTYNHSGVQAIRAALASKANITYKILYNDAVAMTGGQANEGGLSAYKIVDELRAMGVPTIEVVYDEKEDVDLARFKGIPTHERSELDAVQKRLREVKGVSAIVYIQTCAAEKRRRRKRGTFPDPDKRVFINTDVCEGCGDCGVQSNCVSIVPKETELGRKRAIDQSSCNKDFSCLKGFCPSFVTLEGAQVRKDPTTRLDLPDLPEPTLPAIDGTFNVVITGVGGTGVVTVGAVMAQAAHIDGKGAGMMEMAGLAQKGGAVHIHCRLANQPDDITAIRVATGEADALIGGDLVVSAGAKTLGLTSTGRTGAVVNSHEIITGDFTRDTEFTLPADRLKLALEARLQDRVAMFDASDLAKAVLGDSIYSNMMLMGAAWQRGLLPLTHAAIVEAVTLNGAAVERNLRAFEIGRWAVLYPDQVQNILTPKVVALPKTLDEKISYRADHLVQYQGKRLANRYRKMVEGIEDRTVRAAVAEGYHKVLAYKDEYEVARLLQSTRAKAEAEFDGDFKMKYHMAPPVLTKMGSDGRPVKRTFGPWLEKPLAVMARFKGLRGTPLDVFGYTTERKMERALITQYEADMKQVLPLLTDDTREAIVALAELPKSIRGFGPVKQANETKAAKRREELLAVIRAGGGDMAKAAE
ncbi:indolepyruvate ferredoxin oxidoreductase family protein [Pseudosulfitobacter pseudonitzschiae]|uniref:indolepyruvate ferredoxin oxidoreductase family protein n=1 Tax=Pseudosulfitobacter pseudonitzschiae TaxID=1402135 RepID=UPI001AF8D409|nr:indolepyruvate ferredoxin oxidoreductase family protein [Pseudosulfitobacter pseudonitzschiae]MBM1814405.1 indolepyruvate ferredoxin oxidoreductase family protein [Pseudosulfitobacter pseudonitzschiae]MBM1831398.1 indolepyruvate ferredoxin oxidoreductase family protein [Pseudosulfitobacter pseudonitzschiae]MBM1836265.1 indolepyruvate ferredoxin oxidoreductase family protein [Pseudosulfitobacter pseudonitzschiae]MBM1841111.1 indolepyruvate ferredoxin oxidoreductase family protein [Pseudosulfi